MYHLAHYWLGFNIEQTNIALLVTSVVLSLLLRAWFIFGFGRRIAAHSDGGGWDAGTDYTYVPTLRIEHSVVGEGYMRWPPRVRMLSWIVLPFIPVYWLLQLMQLTPFLFFKIGRWLGFAEPDYSYLMPKEWYS
jgi:hypothetical protein